jgi:hypothetical protein
MMQSALSGTRWRMELQLSGLSIGVANRIHGWSNRWREDEENLVLPW